MAKIVVNTYTNEPIPLFSERYAVAWCPKCTAGMGSMRVQYVSEKAAREQYSVEREVLRIECGSCGHGICLVPCADAKEEG